MLKGCEMKKKNIYGICNIIICNVIARISVTVTGFRLFSGSIDPSDDFLCFLFIDCDSSQMSEIVK